MIEHPAFPVEPWTIRETELDLSKLAQRAVAVIEDAVEPLEGEFPVVLQSELVANEAMPVASQDPRAAALAEPLVSEMAQAEDHRAVLVHRTRTSELRVAAAMSHLVDGPEGTEFTAEAFPDLARVLITATVAPGRPLRIVKALAYGWSGERSAPALRDQVSAALEGARHTGWEGLQADSAPTSTPTGSAPMSSSRATPSSSRRCASRCFTPCRRAPAASSARSPPRD